MQPDEDITKKPYFFNNFRNTTEVADFLKHKSQGRVGSYLVRPSFKNPSSFTVSTVVKDKSVRHTNIVVGTAADGRKLYYLVAEKQFLSVQNLLDFYSVNDVKNLEKVNHVRFLHPVTRTRDNDSFARTSSSSSTSSQVDLATSGGSSDRPPLPVRPVLPRRSDGAPTLKQNIAASQSSLNSLEPEGRQRGNSFDSDGLAPLSPGVVRDLNRRPPLPLPESPNRHNPGYYSTPRNVDEDISERLKEALKQSERCDCGIPREMADLPMEWTVHRSKDPGTYGRLFFQNSKGLTTWKIPNEVQAKMNEQQKEYMKQLSDMFAPRRAGVANNSMYPNKRTSPQRQTNHRQAGMGSLVLDSHVQEKYNPSQPGAINTQF